MASATARDTRCWVYLYVDPRNDRPVYVGMTEYPSYRHLQHQQDRSSAVWSWTRENGVSPKMVVVGEFANRNIARHAEERLIAYVPDLANRDVEHTKSRVKWREANGG